VRSARDRGDRSAIDPVSCAPQEVSVKLASIAPVIAAVALAACGGKKKDASAGGWASKHLTSTSANAKDMVFSIDLPDGLVPAPDHNNDDGPAWVGMNGDKQDQSAPRVFVRKSSAPADSLDQMIARALPEADEEVVRKEAVPDGYAITKASKSGGRFTIQFQRGTGKNVLLCLASQEAPQGETLPAGTRELLEKICGSIKIKP
jgi:hypothetical protein